MLTIRVTISGLCLFVPDARTSRVVVLMPRTGAGCQDNVHPHVARLVVPRRPNPNPYEQGDYDYHPMEDCSVVLGDAPAWPNGGGHADTTSLPRQLADLLPFAGRGIERDLLDSFLGTNGTRHCVSRLALAAGACSSHSEPATFSFGGNIGPLCHRLVWTIPNYPGSTLTLRLKRDVEIRPVTPGFLDFEIHHVPDGHLPGQSHTPVQHPPGTPAAHFIGLYSLFRDPSRKEVPIYVSGLEGSSRAEMLGSDPVTCVMGQSAPV